MFRKAKMTKLCIKSTESKKQDLFVLNLEGIFMFTSHTHVSLMCLYRTDHQTQINANRQPLWQVYQLASSVVAFSSLCGIEQP